MHRLILILGFLLMTVSALGQDYSYRTEFSYETTYFTELPHISGDIDPAFPDAARKNGVEGTVKVNFTFGADGKIHDVVVEQNLPFGVGDAVKKAIEEMSFTPARLSGKPVDMKASFTYRITAFFFEDDKNVQKVKLIGKPTAPYPESLRSEGRKGSVNVAVTFYADGKIAVGKTESTMPSEFDAAAKHAAASLKFEPAVHKKSKKAVNQVLWVVFEFKP
jgi:TonB family protein